MSDFNVHVHVHVDLDGPVGDAVTLLMDLMRRGIEQLEQQGCKMSEIDDKVTALQDSASRIESAEDSVKAFVSGLPAVIQAAIDAAGAKGATPEQLQAFTDLNARLSKDADDIVAALVTPGSGGGSTGTAGGTGNPGGDPAVMRSPRPAVT